MIDTFIVLCDGCNEFFESYDKLYLLKTFKNFDFTLDS